MLRVLKVSLAVAASFVAYGVSADCACLCVEGQAKTLCTDINEAAADISECRADDGSSNCPDLDTPLSQPISPPDIAAAENCRRVRIFDPQSGEYSATANVCDVADE